MSNAASLAAALRKAESDTRLTGGEALALADCDDLPRLMALARGLAVAGHGRTVSFSKKVFIPLTRLCRDVCHYCTFARPPRRGERPYLAPEEVLAIAQAGRAAGCKEALFTLGDQPERRYAAARRALAELGAEFTLAYLEASAGLVLRETGLLPHLNPGVMSEDWLRRLRAVSVSQGLMLETVAERLSEKGGPHFGSPDKRPRVRLATLEACGARARAVHDRTADRHRRDAGRAHRVAARDPRAARALRAYPGGDRPELPGQARHAHGQRCGAGAGGSPVDRRRGAHRPRPGHEHPGPAQPAARRDWRNSSTPASTTGAACRR